MKTTSIFKKASLAFTALVAGLLFTANVASAIPYTGDQTVSSPTPAFNVFTGVPTVGNESDFFRSRVPNAASGDVTTPYVDPLNASCTAGQRIQMRVYVHNGASQFKNDNGNGPSVAHGTKVKVSLPSGEATSFNPSAQISSSNAGTVSDTSTINCGGKAVKLHYIPGSASQYSIGSGAVALSDSIVSSGVPITSHGVAGDVWGCWNERVYVLLSVQVEVAPPPPPPPAVTAMCNLFSVTPSENRKVTVSQFKYTANNANFKKVVLDWGDNAQISLTNPAQVVGQSHQYKQDGTYNITAVVTFAVAGKPDIVSGGNGTACVQRVVFKSGQPPQIVPPTTPPPTITTTTPTPTSLVNTGAGSVAGIFAATTAIGAVGHRWFLSRRLSRQ